MSEIIQALDAVAGTLSDTIDEFETTIGNCQDAGEVLEPVMHLLYEIQDHINGAIDLREQDSDK